MTAAAIASLPWKTDWPEARQHYLDWWDRKGLVVGAWYAGSIQRDTPREPVDDPGPPRDPVQRFSDIEYRVACNHYAMATREFAIDHLPIAETNVGPGSLALMLGSPPDFQPTTVWYDPRPDAPEDWGTLRFDPQNEWWQHTERFLSALVERAQGRYAVGCPDLIENIDILASLRGAQELMMDMIGKPDWVLEKVMEINQVWFEVYRRIYDIIKLPDGSSCFSAFALWGPGTVAKVQCDAAAMFSPDMFRQFVVPALEEQCDWLDNSMFHLDGTQCICHLEHLLAIESLDAIEWTPQSGLERGGDPRWFDMYKEILAAGKGVQIIGVGPKDVKPILDALGPAGVYMMVGVNSHEEMDGIAKTVEAYR